MSKASWPLHGGRPTVQITLTFAQSGEKVVRNLLADTGAGRRRSQFELLLDEDDCLLCGGRPVRSVVLGGAYSGTFPVYAIRIEVSPLGFRRRIYAVGLPTVPPDFDGIACFRFLNRFTYGNFGDPDQFGLETLPNT